MGLLTRSPDCELDILVKLATTTTSMPIASISLIGEHAQIVKASAGMRIPSGPRFGAVCNDTLISDGEFLIEDTLRHPKYANQPVIAAGMRIRSYAGVPIEIEPGLRAGVLCVMDRAPRKFTQQHIDSLHGLAVIAAARLREVALSCSRQRLAFEPVSLAVPAPSEQAIRLQSELSSRAIELSGMGAFEIDQRDGTSACTPSLRRLYDRRDEETGFEAQMLPGEWTYFSKLADQALADATTAEFDCQLTTFAGRRRWFRTRISREMDGDTEIRRFGVQRDITEEKQTFENISYLAGHDHLTGLLNRYEMRQRAGPFLSSRSMKGGRFGLAILDVDEFRAINDMMGHEAGDACLQEIGRRLKLALAPEVMLARHGGDEFVLLGRIAGDIDEVRHFFEEILRLIRRPVYWRGQSFELSAGIGCAEIQSIETFDFAATLRHAELALQESKKAGSNTVRFFDRSLLHGIRERARLLTRARDALAEGAFELFYQPRVNIETYEVDGFEALIRWRQPDGTVHTPGRFLPVLEDNGLSLQIGHFVIREAIAQAARWRREGERFGRIAINVSTSQFLTPSFATDFLQAVIAGGAVPQDFEIEVTETVILSQFTDKIVSELEILRHHGISVALDDFGTGHASLTHLRHLPYDIIKIDRSFIAPLPEDGESASITQGLLSMASLLRKDVIAEGIETHEQLAFVRNHGCRRAQGFLLGHPVAPQELPKPLNGRIRFGETTAAPLSTLAMKRAG